MKRYWPYILIFTLTFFLLIIPKDESKGSNVEDSRIELFNRNISYTGLSYKAFNKAVNGYTRYKNANIISGNIIAIIDYDLPSTKNRLFIIDIQTYTVLHSSLVAHGKETGSNYAKSFSNTNGSHQSSLGFYKTSEKYVGKHGVSLRLDGLEPGINDKARSRNIVIHAANYVSEKFVKQNHRLGRSFGCPAIPEKDYQKVLDLLDDEILLYAYSSNIDNN